MDVSSSANQPMFDIAAFKKLYQSFDDATLRELPKFYSPLIIFKDPIHELKGITAITQYFSNFCNPETRCEFEFTNQLIANDQIFLQWQMHYCHPKLASGKLLKLNGGTLIKVEKIRVDKKITYQEDFYDMGAMIYQHVPLLGWATKKINAHLTNNVGEHA